MVLAHHTYIPSNCIPPVREYNICGIALNTVDCLTLAQLTSQAFRFESRRKPKGILGHKFELQSKPVVAGWLKHFVQHGLERRD